MSFLVSLYGFRGNFAVVAAFVFAFAAGCSDSGDAVTDPIVPDEVEAVPFASTKMLSAEDLASLDPDKEDGVLVFHRAPTILNGATTGDVIVGGVSPSTPHGVMRVVVDAARVGDELTLHTVGAPPQLAFQKLHARVARPVSLNDGPMTVHDNNASPLDLGHVGGSQEHVAPVNVILFDGDGDKATTNDQLRIEGSFTGGIKYDLTLDVNWGDVRDLPAAVTSCVAELVKKVVNGKKPTCRVVDLLPEAKVTFTVDPRVASELRIVGQASLEYEKEFDIATVSLAPVVLGPIVFLPTLDVIAKVEGGASASFRAGVKGHLELTSSVTVSSRSAGQPQVSPPKIKDKGFTVEEPEVGLHAHAQANVGVRLAMPLYGTIGPYATAEATLSLVADPSRTPCFEARAGLESTIGVRITSPTLPFLGHVELVNWHAAPIHPIDEVIASGACKDPPPELGAGGHLPPGSGPDAASLREPSFVPWSHIEEGVANARAADNGPSLAGLLFSHVDRAIDGRWLVSGSEATSLIKMNDEGQTIWRAAYFTNVNGVGSADPDALSTVPLLVLRTAPMRDASIAILAGGTIGRAFQLIEIGQAGGVRLARAYSFAPDECGTPEARLLTSAADGLVVVGECSGQRKLFVARLNAATGDVLAAQVWASPNAGDEGLSPVALTRSSAGDLVVVGTAGKGMLIARMSGDALVSTRRYTGCAEAFNIAPTAVIPAESNGLTIVGGTHAQSRSFVARIRDNGDVGFATYLGLVNGRAPVFVATAIAELPTSGFVMAASITENTAKDAANIPGVALIGLDAQGRTTWSNRYALPLGRSSAFSALNLTTDGGALVTSLANGSTDSSGSWSMKLPAKDGSIGSIGDGGGIASADITSTPLVLDGLSYACPLEGASFDIIGGSITLASEPVEITRK